MRRLAALTLAGLGVWATVLVSPTLASASSVRAFSLAPQPASAAEQTQSVGVIVKFQSAAAAPPASKLLTALDGSTAQPSIPKQGIYTFAPPPGQTDSEYALQLMLEAPGVAYAEPNYVRQPFTYTAPTDPYFTDTTTWALGTDYYPQGRHWWLNQMHAVPAWQFGQGDTYPTHGSADDIKVADLDVGMYLTHPDLNGATFVVGKDEFTSYDPITNTFGPPDSDVTPDTNPDVGIESHGTGTAAAIGAEINGVGMVGIGYNPKVVCYKVAGPITRTGNGFVAGDIVLLDSQAILGIHDAVDAGCKVINMSFGGPGDSVAYQDAVNYAHAHGVVVVAAVGNDGDNTTVNYPAACTYVTGVGAIELVGGPPSGVPSRVSFSDFAPGVVDLAAPGMMFWTADKPGYDADGAGSVDVPGYQFESGTSFSSPAVAGAIAYLWRAIPDLSADEIVSRVESSAADLGSPGRDDEYGYGVVDMQAAYAKLIADYPTLAKPSVTASAWATGHQAPASWNAVSGYNVKYRVSVDGVLRSNQTSTSIVATSLADGVHTISVVPTSTRNWNTTTGSATATFTEDSIAPVVGGFAYDGATLTWSVTEANPYAVSAYVDTATPSAPSTNALTPGSLSSGMHALHVMATDAAGNSSGWVSWPFGVNGAPPVLGSIVVTDALSAEVTWPAVPGASSYDYRVNGGSTVSTPGPGFVLTGLTGGVTQVEARSVVSGAPSAWAAATVTDVVVVPGTPVPSVPATVGLPSAGVTWAGTANALSYEYRLDGGVSAATTGTNAMLPLATTGTHTVEVRAADNLANSAWASAIVVYMVPAPVLSAPTTVSATTATVTWDPVPGATAYQYSVDGRSTVSTLATSVTATGVAPGNNTVAVRTLQGANASAWSTATITDVLLGPPSMTLSASASRVTYPANALNLTGSISQPGKLVRVLASTDGQTWTDTGVSWMSPLTPSPVAVSVPIARSTRYQLAFDGDGVWAPAVSPVVSVDYMPRVDKPSAPKSVKRNRRFTLSETVSAPAANPAASVAFKLYRYQKAHGRKTWVLRRSVRVKGTASGASTVFKASLSISVSGSWRVIGAYTGTPVYASATSGARAFTVK